MSIVTGEIVERFVPGIGELRFENLGPGEWLTQKGTPAKKARRRYLLGEQELDSVSSVVNALDKPALVVWAETQGTIAGVKAERLGELRDVPEEDWVDRCRLLGLGASAARDEGANRGLAIHTAFEAMAQTGDPPDFSRYPAQWRPWLQGAVRAWLALDPSMLDSELTVCNPPFGYAGRFDLHAISDGKRTLIDYKTGRGRVYDQAHFQARGYAECFKPCGLEPPERIVIVGIDDEGGFQLVDCEATAEDWYGLLSVYRARKRINAGMAVQRKIAKKAAQA